MMREKSLFYQLQRFLYMKNKYARVFAMIKQINSAGGSVTHTELLNNFTQGKTSSLNDLGHFELQEFERSLQRTIQKTKSATDYKNEPLDKSRKAIISQFRSIGRTPADAIAWAERYGVNGTKKTFNSYTGQELFVLLRNAKKVKADFIKAANQKL